MINTVVSNDISVKCRNRSRQVLLQDVWEYSYPVYRWESIEELGTSIRRIQEATIRLLVGTLHAED